MRKALRIILGVVLIVIGVLAAVTPLSPGSWLALIGLELLGIRILVERKFLSLIPEKYRRKFKKLLKKKAKKHPREIEK